MFVQNWNSAKAAGIPRGAYHFVYWCRPAAQQAQWFVQHIPQDADALPPVPRPRVERPFADLPRKVPRDQALAMIKIMLTELERHTGKRPIIYTDITFHEEILKGEFEDYPFWIRSVAAEPQERYTYRRWTSGSGPRRARCRELSGRWTATSSTAPRRNGPPG